VRFKCRIILSSRPHSPPRPRPPSRNREGDRGRGGSGRIVYRLTNVVLSSFGASSKSGSKLMPRDRPSAVSLSLISFNDFLPKLRYLSISLSVFIANWPTVVIFALFKQFAARTLS